jgi:hypothetical protein
VREERERKDRGERVRERVRERERTVFEIISIFSHQKYSYISVFLLV